MIPKVSITISKIMENLKVIQEIFLIANTKRVTHNPDSNIALTVKFIP